MAPAGLGWIGAALALVTTFASGIMASRQAKKQAAAQKSALAQQQEIQNAANQGALIELEKMKYQYAMWQESQAAEAAAEKEKEKKIIKYGSLIATGVILSQMIKD